MPLINTLKQYRRQLGIALAVAYTLFAIGFTAVILVAPFQMAGSQSYRIERPVFLFYSLGITLLGLLIGGVIWQSMATHFNLQQRFAENLTAYVFSLLGNLIPGGIWNIVGRTTYYEVRGGQTAAAALASVIETLLLAISSSLVLLTIWAMLSRTLHPALVLVLALSLFIGAVAATPHLFHPLLTTIRRLTPTTNSPSVEFPVISATTLGGWLLLEAVIIMLGGLNIYATLASVTTIDLNLLLPVTGAWAATSAMGSFLFWLPGNRILRDGLLAGILAAVFPATDAIIYTVGIRAWFTVSLLACVVVLALGIWAISRLTRPTTPTSEP